DTLPQLTDLVVQTLHGHIESIGGLGSLFQLVQQVLGNVLRVLVVNLVFQTRPEVHRDRTDLDLHRNLRTAVRHVYRGFHDQVQASVTVRLGNVDVILDLSDHHVFVPDEHVPDRVHVGDETAGDPDPRD